MQRDDHANVRNRQRLRVAGVPELRPERDVCQGEGDAFLRGDNRTGPYAHEPPWALLEQSAGALPPDDGGKRLQQPDGRVPPFYKRYQASVQRFDARTDRLRRLGLSLGRYERLGDANRDGRHERAV